MIDCCRSRRVCFTKHDKHYDAMAEECPDCIHSLSEEMMAAKVKFRAHHDIFWSHSDFYVLYLVGNAKCKVLNDQLLA